MMANERDEGLRESEGAPVEQEVSGGFFPSMLDIFVDPMKVFRRIAAGMSWWKAFIAVTLFGIILVLLNKPVQDRIMEIQYATMDKEQAELVAARMEQWAFLGYIAIPIIVMVSNLIVAGIAHLVNSAVSMRANFKKTLTLAMFCNFIGVLAQIIGSIIIRARGFENIESAEDLRVSFGIGALFPDLKGFWYVFSESFNLFQIWYYIIFTLGVAAIFSMERKKAVPVGIVVWLVTFLMMLLENLGGRAVG
jgi:hypothetical protein